MFRRRIQIKLFAVFVMAFVCLNASGAACLAYCETLGITAETDECPLKKLSEHCDKAGEQTPHSISVDSHEIDCCPIVASFFTAPVEAKSFSFETAAQAVPIRSEATEPTFGVADTFAATSRYRGPPPLDRRIDRLKYQVFRI